jgi:hypothetical protein
VWRVVKATGRAWEPVSPTGLLLEDSLTARIAPRAALAALVAVVRAAGGEVAEGVTGEKVAGPVVWATGAAGLQDLSRDMGRPAGAGQKGQAALLALALPDAPQIFAGGVHLVPHADGTVAVGSTTEPEASDPGTDARLDALIARARGLCPMLADAPVVARWAGFRPRASHRAPVLGGLAGARRVFCRERRLQDRLRHCPRRGRGDGRSDPGRARPDSPSIRGRGVAGAIRTVIHRSAPKGGTSLCVRGTFHRRRVPVVRGAPWKRTRGRCPRLRLPRSIWTKEKAGSRVLLPVDMAGDPALPCRAMRCGARVMREGDVSCGS